MNKLILDSGTELVITDRVAVTVQFNDLTKPESVQAAYSTDFTLADSVEVRAAMEQAQAGTSTTAIPYTDLRGSIVSGGVEVLPRAVVQVREHEEGTGFSATAFGGNKDFYATINEKSIRDLDLSEFDHDWTPENIVAAAARTTPTGWADGYTYDFYDRGHDVPAEDERANLVHHGLWPSVWCRLLWERIMSEAGVRWSGNLPTMFDRELLPSTEPTGYSEQTRESLQLRTGIRMYGHVRKGPWGVDVLPYGYMTGPFVKGSAVEFDQDAHEYVVKLRGYYKLNAGLSVGMTVGVGKIKFRIDLEVNGNSVSNSYVETGNELGPQLLSVNYGRILLQVGDRIRVTARGEKATLVTTDPRWLYPIVQGQFWPGQGPILPPFPDNYPPFNDQKFTIELLEEFPIGGRVRLVDWIPDLTQRDFVKSVIARYGLTQQNEPYADEVHFNLTAPVATTTPVDWSSLIDASYPPKRSWRVGDYVGHNWFRWTADETNPVEAVGLGDGELTSPARPEETSDVVTQPFAATIVGEESGYLLIPYWVARIGTDPVEYDTQSPQPRLVLLTDRTTPRFEIHDGYFTGVFSPLPISEFLTPAGDDLDFARTLLPTYYPHLAAVLRRPFVLTVNVRLTSVQVAAFTQLTPVWLEREGHSFYVNKIQQYEADAASTAVELLCLTPA